MLCFDKRNSTVVLGPVVGNFSEASTSVLLGCDAV
jgi:hypothetical protein